MMEEFQFVSDAEEKLCFFCGRLQEGDDTGTCHPQRRVVVRSGIVFAQFCEHLPGIGEISGPTSEEEGSLRAGSD
jgi:hypothetical protein